MTLESVDTPALIIDLDALEENIRRLAEIASSHGVQLRPHAKTHRCSAIAQRQLAQGAVGVCCQTVGEAEVMAAGGVPDILISNEVWGKSKLTRVAALARKVKLAICVDDSQNVSDLNAAASANDATLDVLVDINVIGDIRTGVEPGEAAVRLAHQIASSSSLRFAGLQGYTGKAQHVRDFATRESVVRRAVESAAKTHSMLTRDGLACPSITGSGTGTCRLEASSGVYTELQAGSYIFMDADYSANLGPDGRPSRDFENSLFVYSTIMSKPTDDSAVLDAGLKSSSFDSGPPVLHGVTDAEVIGVGDEHLRLRTAGRRFPYSLGDKVRLVPGHCDPTVNMHDWLVGVRHDRVEAIWAVDARGSSR